MGASFCNQCGADAGTLQKLAQQAQQQAQIAQPMMRARAGFVAVGRGMSVCHQCGTMAPTQRSTCEVCSAPIGSSLEAIPARSDALSFALMRTQIKCRQCGGSFPLDEPELDEAVTCPRCSTMQAFDLSAWSEAFNHAHLVSDVYGPRGVGFRSSLQRDPHRDVGVQRASIDLQLTGMSIEQGVMKTRNLHCQCASGQPLCTKCGCPREARAEGRELHVRCVGCGDLARYEVPEKSRQLAPSLVGIIAEGLRVDRPEARLDATSAGIVIALRCPSCGGGLQATPGSHVAVCSFCKTEARIASRTLLALKTTDGTPQPYWAVFQGNASARRDLIAPPRDEDDDDDEGMKMARLVGQAVVASVGSSTEVLYAMAESPAGPKMMANAASQKVKALPDDISPTAARLELLLQLALPLLAVLVVSPFFFGRLYSLIDPTFVDPISSVPILSALHPAPSTIIATLQGAPGVPVQPTPGVLLVPYLVRDGDSRPICDDAFSLEDATVTCRQLGFQGATSFETVLGGTDAFWLDDLSCHGTEARLDDCGSAGWGEDNCSAGETQAVVCF